jgi:predicted dehydrogenase
MTADTPLRWGILSTARIARRNWRGMLGSGSAVLAAVASRDLTKAEGFIDEMQALAPWPVKPVAHGTYESLLESPDIDAVYIPLPTAIRKEWVLRAAAAGKHVLCEKPCAVNAADLREMIACCEENGVLFMDGVVFMHDPRFEALRELVDDGTTVGKVKRITSAFSFRADDEFASRDIRGTSGLEPTGCLGDLGWYCLRASLWALNWQLPERVTGRVLDSVSNASGATAIMGFSGELDFYGGATASYYCSFVSPNQRWLVIGGTDGCLRVPDFISPVAANDTDWEIGYVRQPRTIYDEMIIVARMFSNFAAAAKGQERNWAEYALKTQIVQDACMESSRLGCPLCLRNGEYLTH